MPGPFATGKILVLYGHGALTDSTLDFRRAHEARINIYSWTREGIPVWDTQIQLAADDALSNGNIRESFATVNSSRIGGTLFRNYALFAPTGLRLPTIPTGFQETPIEALGATVHHNGADIASSSRMVLMLDDEGPFVFLSDIFNDDHFADLALDVLWCACKS